MTAPEHTPAAAPRETTAKAHGPTRGRTLHRERRGRKPAPAREQLTLTWFVESGDTDEERTRWVEDGFRAEKTFENEWTPDRVKDYAPGTARIVVIRDNRGGVDWRAAAVKLGATP